MENFSGRKRKLKEAEDDLRVQKIVEQKQKNSNERELERFLEEERQMMIKKELDFRRKEKSRQMWSQNMLNSPELFDHSSTIIKTDKNVLNNGSMNFMGRTNLI